MSVLPTGHAGRYNAAAGRPMTDQPNLADKSKVRLDPKLEAEVRSELAQGDASAGVDALKVLVARGYQIVPPPQVAPGDPPPRTVAELAGLESTPLLTLPELKRMSVGQMIQLWHAWDREKFRGSPSLIARSAAWR